MEIRSVGIVGAGQMGAGIAQVFTQAGFSVLLNDISAEALEAARAGIDENLARQVERGRISAADHAAAMDRLALEPDLTRLGPCDLIIESATENEAVKVEILEDADPAPGREHHPDHQHLVNLDHPAGLDHRSARTVHGAALHEPGAGDGAGRADPGHRHR